MYLLNIIAFAFHFDSCRWSLISEEYYAAGNFLYAPFLSAGKTLPIFRGGGLGQCNLQYFIERTHYVLFK